MASFLQYLSHLHPMTEAFWQRPKRNFVSADYVWYDNTPLGNSTISKIMTRTCQVGNMTLILGPLSVSFSTFLLTFVDLLIACLLTYFHMIVIWCKSCMTSKIKSFIFFLTTLKCTVNFSLSILGLWYQYRSGISLKSLLECTVNSDLLSLYLNGLWISLSFITIDR